MNVAVVPIRGNVDDLWAAYQRLAQRVIDDPRVMTQRGYCEALASAHRRWVQAYLAGEARA